VTPRFRLVIGATLAGALLSGCGTQATKEDTGAVVGAVGGAAVGSQVGGGNGRTAAVIVGAAAGGVLGAKYGRYLDERDRQNVTHATERALATNAPQAYTAHDSGAKVTVTPGPSTYENALRVQIKVSPQVDTNYPLRADRRTVFAMTDMDLRSAPRLTSKTTRVYRRWEQAEVVAIVPNSQYRLVSIDGTAVGYAREVYLAARREDVPPPRYASRPMNSKTSSAHAAQPRRLERFQPDCARRARGDLPVEQGASTRHGGPWQGDATQCHGQSVRDRPHRQAESALVLKSECKVVKRTIQFPDRTTESETVKFCKEPPSSWRQVT
jgi:surface antigen